ncbi:hypothetical protein JOF56_000728 [Kibdelosporangium banguiense]|uniref:DUF4367 domain-containing protein n=1 Tax=Kibdelosporangium banguiense TaxID=1365924 RepID=A0ABS4T7F4_9PSEU|nr:hypothetical protein [Kibdelosporangium banguiense]MBP2320343.1 hypothetical protein [Kibdelosporangium banguiense]
MTLEESIKDVFQQRAELTPDHHRLVNAVMAATAARRRPSRGVFALLSASVMSLVAAAVSVPLLVTGAPQPVQPPASTVVTAPASTVPGTNPVMRYRATWLPDGMVENLRSLEYGPEGMTRQWSSSQNPTAIAALRVANGTALSNPGTPPPGRTYPVVEQVDVNGKQGNLVKLNADDGFVEWLAEPDKVVRAGVSRLPDAYAAALRMARSVQPDTTDFTPDVQFGWMPGSCRPTLYSAMGGSDGAYLTLDSWGPGCTGLKVEIEPQERDTSGQLEQVTVRGKQGYYQSHGGDWGDIGVQLTDKYWLYLNTQGTKADLIRIVDELTISDLRLPWLG